MTNKDLQKRKDFQIVKRDGRVAPWSPGRIIRAVALAFYGHKYKDRENPERNSPDARFGLDTETFNIVEQISANIVEAAEGDLGFFERGHQPTVDEIGQLTEKMIAEAGHWEVARTYMLYRSKHEELRTVRHGENGLQEYIAIAKYAQYREDLGRRELYIEATDRVREMHLRRYEKLLDKRLVAESFIKEQGLPPELGGYVLIGETLGAAVNKAFDGVRDKRWLPSMRSMQFGGKAIERNNARIFNCAYGHISRVRAFPESMFLLLSGTGVGFSVQRHHVDQLPAFPVRKSEDDLPVEHYLIPDTIEGWSDSLGVLITSYIKSVKIEFNYSAIRPKGSPLKSSGGRAPGHLPLKRALTAIEQVLNKVSGRKMKPIEAYDIMMHAARAVLSGGIRRSATIALFSPDDQEMASAKTGNWFESNSQRSGSNNSAVLVRSEANEKEFNELFEKQKEFGEPGFYFSESAEYGTNPCVTADTWVMTSEGAKQVADLIGVPFKALVDGAAYDSSLHGFVQTGHKPVYEIETDRGIRVKLTFDHPLKVLVKNKGRNGYSEVWKKAGELVIGDRIKMHDHEGMAWGEPTPEERQRGYLLGSLLGDGNIEKSGSANLDFWGDERAAMKDKVVQMMNEVVTVGNTGNKKFGSGDTPKYNRCRVSSRGLGALALEYGLVNGCKKVTSQVEMASSQFTAGFLSGWFDADGFTNGQKHTGFTIRLSSSVQEDLEAAQRMLGRLGIFSRVYTKRRAAGFNLLPDGKGGQKLYPTKALKELIIAGKTMIQRFQNVVGFTQESKKEKLKNIVEKIKNNKGDSLRVSVVKSVKYKEDALVYDCTISEVHAFDANGLYIKNCSEIGLAPFITVAPEDIAKLREYGYELPLKVGDTLFGFQMCNLTTINGGQCTTPEMFYEACASASLIGTLQAAYTDMPYLGAVTRLINEREALLGVSITGMLDSPAVLLDPKVLENGAAIVKGANILMADALGINRAARTTAIKPEGTTSLLLGSGSGIHPHHAKRYFRRVQANRLENVYVHFKASNPHMTEPSIFSPLTDDVLTFPVEAPEGAILRDQIGAIEFLKTVKLVQKHWVIAGRAHELYNPGLHHNVSNTVTVRPEEWEEVRNFLWENREYFTGVSLLQAKGDKAYAQAPREAVTTLADAQKWNQLNYNKVDYTLLLEAEDNTSLKDIVACAGGSCELF